MWISHRLSQTQFNYSIFQPCLPVDLGIGQLSAVRQDSRTLPTSPYRPGATYRSTQSATLTPFCSLVLTGTKKLSVVSPLTSLQTISESTKLHSTCWAACLWSKKSFHTAAFWTTLNPTILTLSLPDLSVFSFPPGSLCSAYLNSSDLQFSFSQNEQDIPPNLYQSTGLSTFCLRSFVHPTSDSYAKLSIILYPFPLSTLAADNPLYLDPNFPGLKLADYEVPLAPPSLLSPINIHNFR